LGRPALSPDSRLIPGARDAITLCCEIAARWEDGYGHQHCNDFSDGGGLFGGGCGDPSGAHLDGANFFKAVLDGADLAGAFLNGAQFLNCAQLLITRNWQSAFRDETLGCGASIPD
jgi:hypothetical protein